MISSVATAEATLELSHDLEGIRRELLTRFSDLGQFEGFLLGEQTSWDDQTNPVVRVIALHNVAARVSLTSKPPTASCGSRCRTAAGKTGTSIISSKGVFPSHPLKTSGSNP